MTKYLIWTNISADCTYTVLHVLEMKIQASQADSLFYLTCIPSNFLLGCTAQYAVSMEAKLFLALLLQPVGNITDMLTIFPFDPQN